MLSETTVRARARTCRQSMLRQGPVVRMFCRRSPSRAPSAACPISTSPPDWRNASASTSHARRARTIPALGSYNANAIFARSNWGYSRATSSTFGVSNGIPSCFQSSRVLSVKASGAGRKMKSPVLKNKRTFICRPHSASNAVHRSMARFAQVVHNSARMPRSPYELRTPRVSSPDVARELPGPYASTSLTRAPSCRR